MTLLGTIRHGAALLTVGLLAAACLEVRDDGAVDGGAEGCGYCHATLGGAHAVHNGGVVDGGATADCVDCHPVPADWFVEGHVDGVVDVRFPDGTLATTGGLSPTWDGAVCAQVYCHGATLAGAQYPLPRWTDSFPDGLACTACHGDPPPDPHPAGDDCAVCHGGAYGADGELDPSAHLNGVIEMGGSSSGVGP
jgi:predicted CxxxxCH...CXXCH cytochrome family protein